VVQWCGGGGGGEMMWGHCVGWWIDGIEGGG
jgi:hypothetical protein